jgi:hypothetical protein
MRDGEYTTQNKEPQRHRDTEASRESRRTADRHRSSLARRTGTVLLVRTPLAASCDVLRLQSPSRDPVFQKPGIEGDQEADAFLGHPQVGDELSFKRWDRPFDAFDLDYHEIFHNEIDPILSEEMASITELE